MKKITFVIVMVCLLMLIAVPVLADFGVSFDLTGGNTNNEFYNGVGVKQTESSNLTGFTLGLGYDYEALLLGLDYTSAGLSDNIGGSTSFSLGDYSIGYRFYENEQFNSAALLAYNNESSGAFSAGGWTAGLGAKYQINPKWSLEGRLGYSLFGGVSVKNGSNEYQNPSLFTYALKINYLISDVWSTHAGYRHYGFSGNSNGHNVESNTNLYSIGLTYRFGVNPVKPNSEPKQTVEPQSQPAPVPEPKSEPAPQPKEEPKSQPTSVSEPAPQLNEEPKSQPIPILESKAEPAPKSETENSPSANTPEKGALANREKIEKVNNALKPIFFNFDKYNIRSNQVPVLKKDLEILQANPDMFILIGGHADSFGTALYNDKLSARRANTVKKWLIQHGVDPARISIAAYGEKNPYKVKSNDPKWESDRWVDIFVTEDCPTEETGIRK